MENHCVIVDVCLAKSLNKLEQHLRLSRGSLEAATSATNLAFPDFWQLLR